MCMMLWGVVQLQLRPGSGWWFVLQAAAAARVQQMGPRDVAQVRHVGGGRLQAAGDEGMYKQQQQQQQQQQQKPQQRQQQQLAVGAVKGS
jgi:predicted methyltransferase